MQAQASETFTADVTQFLRPTGRVRACTVDLPLLAKHGYDAMHDAGCRLTAEELTTGEVSLCIEEPGLGDFDICLTPNGPEVRSNLVAMLSRFDASRFAHWAKDRRD